jgi:uncharacterized protein (TIGR00730 family)
MRNLRRICVSAGSSNDVPERYIETARSVGRFLAERGIGLVYGGGNVGLMGALANAALEAGGEVQGVIPDKLRDLELAHEGVTRLFVVRTMHERKHLMADLSDAFIALPGGWGTLEELFEVTTWTQLEYHQKPVGLLNVHGYYDHLLSFLKHAGAEGFVRPQHQHLIQTAEDPSELLVKLRTVELPRLDGARLRRS